MARIEIFFVGFVAEATPVFNTNLGCVNFPLTAGRLYPGGLAGLSWAVVGIRPWVVRGCLSDFPRLKGGLVMGESGGSTLKTSTAMQSPLLGGTVGIPGSPLVIYCLAFVLCTDVPPI